MKNRSHDLNMSTKTLEQNMQSGEHIDGECERFNFKECEFDNSVEHATNALLMRNFKTCYKICQSGIARAKLFIEHQSAQKCIESLCVLCIQALAEMDMWQDVLSMVQNVYDSIEMCPSTVIQLCLLLHAKVKEFSQCHAIASIWLRYKDNSLKPGYDRVAALYVEQIMLPQGQLVLVQQFLNSCTHLKEDTKVQIFNDCEKLWNHKKELNKKDSESEDKLKPGCELQEKQSKQKTEVIEDFSPSLVGFMKNVGTFFAKKLSFLNIDKLWKIAFATLGLTLLLRMSLHGELMENLGRATTIMHNVINVVKFMFTPTSRAGGH